jgi:hypothetical protein
MDYLGLISIFLASSTQGSSDLTAEQLVLLMRASSEQYRSISSRINGTGYQAPTNVKFTQQIISRWTREKEFIKIAQASNYDPVTGQVTSSVNATYTDTYLISPTWSKCLMEVSGSRNARGLICSSAVVRAELPCYTLYTAMWGLGGYPWDLIKLDEAQIAYDEKDGLYILRAKITDNPKGPKIRLFVDPSKGYIPVKQENLTYEDVCFSTYECKDFRLCGGELWIPYEYLSTASQLNYSISYKAEDVVVNEPIADSLLDFDFPEGTIVTDERIGAKYRAGKSAGSFSSTEAQQGSTEPNAAAMLTGTATDEELRASAIKASELLATNAFIGKQPPAVEVSPQMVFVGADKSEYKLTVKSVDGREAELVNYSFASDRMSVLSLKNQIAQQGQLIVNIKRQAGHSGFEKGLLTLQFTQGKVEVTFVSPPLENAP